MGKYFSPSKKKKNHQKPYQIIHSTSIDMPTNQIFSIGVSEDDLEENMDDIFKELINQCNQKNIQSIQMPVLGDFSDLLVNTIERLIIKY